MNNKKVKDKHKKHLIFMILYNKKIVLEQMQY